MGGTCQGGGVQTQVETFYFHSCPGLSLTSSSTQPPALQTLVTSLPGKPILPLLFTTSDLFWRTSHPQPSCSRSSPLADCSEPPRLKLLPLILGVPWPFPLLHTFLCFLTKYRSLPCGPQPSIDWPPHLGRHAGMALASFVPLLFYGFSLPFTFQLTFRSSGPLSWPPCPAWMALPLAHVSLLSSFPTVDLHPPRRLVIWSYLSSHTGLQAPGQQGSHLVLLVFLPGFSKCSDYLLLGPTGLKRKGRSDWTSSAPSLSHWENGHGTLRGRVPAQSWQMAELENESFSLGHCSFHPTEPLFSTDPAVIFSALPPSSPPWVIRAVGGV